MIARMPELSFSDDIGQAEAQQAVDFFLIEDALGAAFIGLHELGGCRRPWRPIARRA